MIIDRLRAIWRFRLGFMAFAVIAFVPATLAYEWSHGFGSPATVAAVQVANLPAPQPTAQPTTPPSVQPTLAPTLTPSPTATIAPTPTGASRFASVHPNELGKFMILEYHVIGDEEERWTRTRAHFRQDLDYLYRHGYYLVGLNQMLDDRVQVPAGKTPVVITFDDSNRSQFQFIKAADGTLKVDPASGLGILDAFTAEHPDFGKAAVFCVLPGADPPNDLFGQPEYKKDKLQYLVQDGAEICNHTLWHADLSTVSEKEAVHQLAGALKIIQDLVPGYNVNVFNPPHGSYPKNVNEMYSGSEGGTTYNHRAILKVGAGPMTAPDDKATNFGETERIQAIPSELDKWFTQFEQHPEQRYVSDGDPDTLVFPADLMKNYDPRPGAKEEPSPDPAYKVIRLR